MLELAHKLADSDEKFFGGWVLAGAEIHIHGRAQQLQNTTLLAKERRSIIQVLGTNAAGEPVKELRVFLVLPKKAAAEQTAAVLPHGTSAARHIFTLAEIQDYVAYTGDENIIHKGNHPIVPGLCMAAWLQKELQLDELDWRISFLAPVYAGDELAVYNAGQELHAYAGTALAFIIKQENICK